MKVIDLLNKIANGEIEDKRTFNLILGKSIYRSIYYDKEEANCMCCLKNASDDYSIYDDISFDTEIETIEKEKNKIEKIDVNYLQQIKKWKRAKVLGNKINEIIDKINEMEEK